MLLLATVHRSALLIIILVTYWTILGRHQAVAFLALSLHCIELLSADVEVGLVQSSLGHPANGGDGIGAVSQSGEGFQCRVWNTKTLPNINLFGIYISFLPLILGLAAALVSPKGSLQVRG